MTLEEVAFSAPLTEGTSRPFPADGGSELCSTQSLTFLFHKRGGHNAAGPVGLLQGLPC